MKDYILNLKSIREDNNITQKQLAVIMNIPPQRISEYENYKMAPTLPRLIGLAQALNVSLDELVTFKKSHADYSEEL